MTSDKSFFHPRTLLAYLTRHDSKDEKQKKKKKRGFLFRKAESRSSLTDNYNYRGPYKMEDISKPYEEVSPYDDISPHSFFTDTGALQSDIELQKKKRSSQNQAPVVSEFVIPESNAPSRPSLTNIFDLSSTNEQSTKGNDENDHDGNEDEEILNPYDEDSFHLKPSRATKSDQPRKQEMTPQTSSSSERALKASIELVPRTRRRDRERPSSTVTDESIGQFSNPFLSVHSCCSLF